MEKYQNDPQEKVDYPAFLIERLVKVIAAAQANLRPAELQAGIAKQEGLSFNRRFWMKNGKVVFNPGQLNPDIVRPAGPTDPDVGILLARDAGDAAAVRGPDRLCDALGHRRRHADTARTTQYYLEQTLRRAFGQRFHLGLRPRHVRRHQPHQRQQEGADQPSPAVAERIGSTLGKTVIAAAPTAAGDQQARAGGAQHDAAGAASTRSRPSRWPTRAPVMEKFNDTNTAFLTKVAAVRTLDLAGLGPPRPMEVQVFRLDAETAIVCLPCEIFVELGLAIKQASPFRNTLVIEICNDRPSYVPTAKAFAEGSYEVTNARVKPGAGEMLVDAAVKLLNEVRE